MMQKNESEQNRRKMRRGDKEAILKGLKGGLCDNYYGICCAVKYNMKDNDIIAALKELQKDTYVSMGMSNAQFASAALDVLKIEPYTGSDKRVKDMIDAKFSFFDEQEEFENVAEDWARGTIKETPFWRDGMSVEEYEEERNYLMEHWRDLRQGTYYPFMETTRKII